MRMSSARKKISEKGPWKVVGFNKPQNKSPWVVTGFAPAKKGLFARKIPFKTRPRTVNTTFLEQEIQQKMNLLHKKYPNALRQKITPSAIALKRLRNALVDMEMVNRPQVDPQASARMRATVKEIRQPTKRQIDNAWKALHTAEKLRKMY